MIVLEEDKIRKNDNKEWNIGCGGDNITSANELDAIIVVEGRGEKKGKGKGGEGMRAS